MTTTTLAWLVLLCPLVGTVIIGAGYRVLPGRTAGWIGTGAIALSFALSLAVLASLLSKDPSHRVLTASLWDYDVSAGVDEIGRAHV